MDSFYCWLEDVNVHDCMPVQIKQIIWQDRCADPPGTERWCKKGYQICRLKDTVYRAVHDLQWARMTGQF